MAASPTEAEDRTLESDFVGRDREMRTLREALDDAAGGQGRLVLLPGGAGIGKSRTAAELAGIALSRGSLVLWGRCYEGEGAPAFWPWQGLLRSYTEQSGPDALDESLRHPVAVIAQIAPGLVEQAPAAEAVTTLEPGPARFRLFTAVAGFLQTAAELHARRTDAPIVAMLDDLHWADEPSLLLLQHVVREIASAPLLLACAYRDVGLARGHPLTRALGELNREAYCRRVLLGALSEAETGAYLARSVPSAQNRPALAAAVHRVSEGNPFVMREVVRWLEAEGRLDSDAEATIAIPASVREVIDLRLERLSPLCSRVLTLAAVAGQEFAIGVLVRIRDEEGGLLFGGERVLEALEEAEAAGLIAAAPALGRFHFAHALIREALYDGVPAVRRIRLHGRVAEAMESYYRANLTPHLAELAHHAAQAAPAGEADTAIRYARRAGDRALEMLAHEEAGRLYQLALDVLEQAGDGPDGRRAELLIALGSARMRAGEIGPARDAFAEAALEARALGDMRLLAQAALAFRADVEVPEADERVVGWLEEALAALPAEEERDRLVVLIGLVRARRDGDRRIALSEEALTLARRRNDTALLAEALEVRRLAIWRPENVEERLALSTEAVQAGVAAGSRPSLLQSRWWRINDLLATGDIPALDVELEAYEQIARAARQQVYTWINLLARTTRALLDGRIEEAEQRAGQALALGRRIERPGVLAAYSIQIGGVRYLHGRFAEVEPAARAMLERMPAHRPTRVALALRAQQRRPDAQSELDRLAAREFEDFPRDPIWVSCLCYLSEVAAWLGDQPRVAALYRLLLPHAGANVVVGAGAGVLGAADRYLGILSAALGLRQDAWAHFEAALTLNERMGARPWVACTQIDYAEALLSGGAEPDRRRAHDLLLAALEKTDALGMTGWTERGVALLEQCGATAEPPDLVALGPQSPALPDGLTPREAEVLRLLAAGCTNGQIAAELVLSTHTVVRHIANIYDKIGAHRRTETTAYALRHGLCASEPT